MGDIKFYSPVDFDDTSSGVTIEGDLIANANVGIGTSSPSRKLHIETSGADGSLKLYQATYQQFDFKYDETYHSTMMFGLLGELQYDGNGGYLRLSNNSTQAGSHIALRTANSERIRVTHDGNVLIGTTTDNGDKLTVAGTISTTHTGYTTDAFKVTHNSNDVLLSLYRRADQSTPQALIRTGGVSYFNGGNVGIGTTSPGHLLEINGTGDALSVGNDTNTLTYMRFANERTMIGYSGANAVVQGGLTKGIRFNVNNNTFNSGNAMAIDASGNVGIGTTSPSQKLEVAGNIQATGTRSISSSFDANHYMRLESNSSGGILKGTDGGVITTLVRTYGDSYFNGGNVGIGTTSPSQKLHVDGHTLISAEKYYYVAGTGAGVGSDASGNLILRQNSANLMTTSGSNATFAGDVKADTHFTSSDTNVTLSTNSDGTVFLRPNGKGSTTAQSTFTTSLASIGTNATFAGNVGIGYNAPYDILHLHNSTNSGTPDAQMNFTTGVTGAADGNGFRVGWNGSVANLFLFENADMRFATNNNEKMRITSGGNVGIGTTSPGQKLEINGAVLAGDYRGSANIYLTSPDSWIFRSTGGTERMRITSAGNVGIGTTNPATWKLTVDSTTVYAASFDTTNNTGVAINGNNTTAAQILGYSSTASTYNDLDIRSNSTAGSGIYIDGSESKVGIGTTSPSRTLDVRGDAQILSTSSTGLRIVGGTTSEVYMIFGDADDNSMGGFGYNNNTNELSIDVNNSEAIRIDSSRNVGIGTTSPSYKLEISDDTDSTVNLLRLRNADSLYSQTWDFQLDTSKHLVITGGSGSGGIVLNPGSAGLNVNGNVQSGGIKLDVNTSMYTQDASLSYYSASNGVYLNGAGNTGWLRLNASGANNDSVSINLFGTSAGNFQTFKTNSAERMRITSAGNVGIGTTNPSYKLHVNGTVKGNDVFGNLFSVGNEGKVVSTSSLGLQLQATAGSKPITFFTNVGGNTERMRISHDGNVGIGTTSPGGKLSVTGGMSTFETTLVSNEDWVNSPISILERNNVAATNLADTYSPNINFHWRNKTSKSLWMNNTGVLGYGEYTAAGVPQYDGTIRTGNLIVDTNVGIGTTSPGAKLNVVGTGTQIGSSGYYYNTHLKDTNNSGVLLGGNNTNNGVGFLAGINELAFLTYGTSWGERMRIDSSGNVGILTTSMLNTATNRGSLTIGGSAAGTINIGNGSINFGIYATTAESSIYSLGVMKFSVGSGLPERMRITSAGNVGIGTTSPGNLLHIVASSNNVSALIIQDDARRLQLGRDMIEARSADGSTVQNLYIQPNGNVGIATSSGNVGIGTTSPSAKLDVNGTGTFRGNLDIYKSNARLTINSTGASEQASVDIKNASLYARWILDSDNLFRVYNQTSSFNAFAIKSNGNVGIGTTSPDSKLDIKGDGADIFLQSNDFKIARIQPRGTGANLDKGLFSLFDGSTEDVRIDTEGSSWLNGGDVGIGTTTPGVKFQVVGASTTPSNANGGYELMQLIDTASQAANKGGGVGFGGNFNSSNTKTIFSEIRGLKENSTDGNYAGALSFSTRVNGANITERMRITSAGNVGIGTTSPNAKLNVKGSGTSSSTTALLVENSSGTDLLKVTDNGSATFKNGLILDGTARIFNGNTVWLQGNSQTGTQVVVRNHIGSSKTAGDILYVDKFGTTASSVNVLNAGNILYVRADGKVGIGTTSPGAKLEVRSDGSAAGGAEIRLQHANNNTTDVVSTLNFANNAGSVAMIQGGTTGANNTGYISFFTDNAGASSEKMRILGGGNVGIGTTNPSSNLQVSGDAYVTEQFGQGVTIANKLTNYGAEFRTSGASAQIFFGRSGNSVGTGAIGADSTYVMRVWKSDFSQPFVIKQSGEVGIGTTSPTSKTHIYYGGGAPNGLHVQSSANRGKILVSDNDTAAYMIAENSLASFGRQDALSANNLNITSSGNVGIGTTSPQEKLEVAGTGELSAKINNTQYSRSFTITQGGGYSHLKTSHSSGVAINYGQGNAGILSLFNNTTQAVKINANGNSYFNGGNVGIGTTSPGARLHVTDSIRIDTGGSGPSAAPSPQTQGPTQAQVRTGGNADYYLSEPDEWLLINIGGTDYVLPAYEA